MQQNSESKRQCQPMEQAVSDLHSAAARLESQIVALSDRLSIYLAVDQKKQYDYDAVGEGPRPPVPDGRSQILDDLFHVTQRIGRGLDEIQHLTDAIIR